MHKFAAAIVVIALAAPLFAEVDPAKPLSIEQVLEIRSREQLQALAIARMDGLAEILKAATDGPSADRVAAGAERRLLELEMIYDRANMLPVATEPERRRLETFNPQFDAARKRMLAECNRIAARSATAEPLVAVLMPVKASQREALARRRSAISQLLTLRSQIELYKLQHRDVLPDFRKHGWSALTSRTRTDGTIDDAAGDFGPYLQSAARSPLNDSTRILITRSAPKPDFKYAPNDCGFLYNELTGDIWALDAESRILDESEAQADAR